MATTLTIEAFGADAEGIARHEGRTVFVPGAIPGDVVTVGIAGSRATVLSLDQPSALRRPAFCQHFGACGGCLVQEMERQAYLAWKRELVTRALAQAGLSTTVAPIRDAHGEGRRRALLHVRFRGGLPEAGYMARGSHTLMPLDRCPVLVPALADAPAIAAAVARPLARRGKPLTALLTATQTGLDVDVRGHGEPGPEERLALIEVANARDLARISVHGDILAERRQPLLSMGSARVVPPPGGFLQATEAGEHTLAALALEAAGKARRVADLFTGAGPFALRLAETAAVFAADGDGPAIAALGRAARATPGLKPVTTEVRDLFRRPLLPDECNAFDCIVLDPPRAGAEAQMRQVAASKVRRVVSVSCDLRSFCRDALILTAAGFRLERVTPVDQFAWSRHVELVGLLSR
jgi:23S rRNA (uracil1939-C5)-methyltransferase